jgi:lipopolysaccharide transport system permease protein
MELQNQDRSPLLLVPDEFNNSITKPETIIRPLTGWAPLRLRELWEYRELLFFFVWRDIKVRYKQTLLGVAWAIMQPFFAMLIFTIFFGRLANIPSDTIPYPLFSFAALVPWMYFANALTQSSNSLIEHERIITKVYFPRVILPMAAVLSGVLDFSIAFVLLLVLLGFYSVMPMLSILAIPLLVVFAAATALGVGLWLSALNVQYRDVRYVVPFMVQFWMFATPVVYPTSLVPAQWRPLYGLNPMVGVIDGFRWALFGQVPESLLVPLVSVIAVAVVLIGGLYYFQRMEETFADIV